MASPSATTPALPIATPKNKILPMGGGIMFPRGAFGAGSPESDSEDELTVGPNESPVQTTEFVEQEPTETEPARDEDKEGDQTEYGENMEDKVGEKMLEEESHLPQDPSQFDGEPRHFSHGHGPRSSPYVQQIPPYRGPMNAAAAMAQVPYAHFHQEPFVTIPYREYQYLLNRDMRFGELEHVVLSGEPRDIEQWFSVRSYDPDFGREEVCNPNQEFVPLQREEVPAPKMQNRARTGTFPQGPSHAPTIFDGATKKKFNDVVSPALKKAIPVPNTKSAKVQVTPQKAANVGAQQAQKHQASPQSTKSAKKKKGKGSPQNPEPKPQQSVSKPAVTPERPPIANNGPSRKGNGPKNNAQPVVNRQPEVPHTQNVSTRGFSNDARRYYQAHPFQGHVPATQHHGLYRPAHYNDHQAQYNGAYMHQYQQSSYYPSYNRHQGYQQHHAVPEHYTESQLLAHQEATYRGMRALYPLTESVFSDSHTRQATISPKSAYSEVEGFQPHHGVNLTANDGEEHDDDDVDVGWYMRQGQNSAKVESVHWASAEDKRVHRSIATSPMIPATHIQDVEPIEEAKLVEDEPSKEVESADEKNLVEDDVVEESVTETKVNVPVEAHAEGVVSEDLVTEVLVTANALEVHVAKSVEELPVEATEELAVGHAQDTVAEPAVDAEDYVLIQSEHVQEEALEHSEDDIPKSDIAIEVDADEDKLVYIDDEQTIETVKDEEAVSHEADNLSENLKSVSVESVPEDVAETKQVDPAEDDAASDNDSVYSMVVSYSSKEKGDIFKPDWRKTASERIKSDTPDDISQDYAKLKESFDAPKSQQATVSGWGAWKPAGGLNTPSPAPSVVGTQTPPEEDVELAAEDFPELGAKKEMNTGEKTGKQKKSRAKEAEINSSEKATPTKDVAAAPASAKKKKNKSKKKSGAKKVEEKAAAEGAPVVPVKEENPKVSVSTRPIKSEFPPLPPMPKPDNQWHVATSKKSRHGNPAPPTVSMLDEAANIQLPRSAASSVAGDAPPSGAGLWAKIAATNKPADVIEVKTVIRVPDVKSTLIEPRTFIKAPALPVRYKNFRKLYINNIPKTMTYGKFVSQIKGGLIDDIYISGLSPDFKKGDPIDLKEAWFGYITFYSPEGAQYFIRHMENIYPEGKKMKHGACNQGQICGYIVLDGVPLPVYMRDHDQRVLQSDVEELVEKHNATRVVTMTFKNKIGVSSNAKFKVDRDRGGDEGYTAKWTWDRWYNALGKNDSAEAIKKVVASMQVWEGKPKCYYEKIEHKQFPTSEKTLLSMVPKTRLGPDPAGTWRIKIFFLRIGTADQVIKRLQGNRDFRDHCVFGFADDPCSEIPIYEEPAPVEEPAKDPEVAKVPEDADAVKESTVTDAPEAEVKASEMKVSEDTVEDEKPKTVKDVKVANGKPAGSPGKKKKNRKPPAPAPPPPPAPRMTSQKQFPTLGGTPTKQAPKPMLPTPGPVGWAMMAAKPPAPESVLEQELKENARPTTKPRPESMKKGSPQPRGPRPALPRGNTNPRVPNPARKSTPPRQSLPGKFSRAQTPTPQDLQERLVSASRPSTPRPKVEIPNERGTPVPHNTPVSPTSLQKAFPPLPKSEKAPEVAKPRSTTPSARSQSPKSRASKSPSQLPVRKSYAESFSEEKLNDAAPPKPKPVASTPRGRSPPATPVPPPLPKSFMKAGANWADDSDSDEDYIPAPKLSARLQQLKPMSKVVQEAVAAPPPVQEPKPINLVTRAPQPAMRKVLTPSVPKKFEQDFPALGQAAVAAKKDEPAKTGPWRLAWRSAAGADERKGG